MKTVTYTEIAKEMKSCADFIDSIHGDRSGFEKVIFEAVTQNGTLTRGMSDRELLVFLYSDYVSEYDETRNCLDDFYVSNPALELNGRRFLFTLSNDAEIARDSDPTEIRFLEIQENRIVISDWQTLPIPINNPEKLSTFEMAKLYDMAIGIIPAEK